MAGITGTRARVASNGSPGVSVGEGQSSSRDSAALERGEVPPHDVDVDVTAHWEFDEESFSEVLTYYGSSGNLQVWKRRVCRMFWL